MSCIKIFIINVDKLSVPYTAPVASPVLASPEEVVNPASHELEPDSRDAEKKNKTKREKVKGQD